LIEFERTQAAMLRARLKETPRFIQIVAGPRQVGKTTLVQQVLTEIADRSLYVSADLPVAPTAQWIEQQWQRALLAKPSVAAPFVLALDEVQKVHRWSDVVKSLWDQRPKGLHLVLLGSSQFLMQHGLSESLTGRFEVIRLPHWAFSEMRESFGYELSDYVCFGGYPGPAALISDPERWRRYILDAVIEPTVSRDVLSLARIDKPALLRRVMELGSVYSGQILSYQKMLGQLQDAGNTVTLSHYLELLSASWLVTGLQKYAGDIARMKGSSPKLQVFDAALQVAQSVADLQNFRQSEGMIDPELWGRLIESSVGTHILNTKEPQHAITYWRERNAEVDFVVSGMSGVLAIEVKSGRRTRALSGLKGFQTRFPGVKTCIVGTGGIPLAEFLGHPVSAWYAELTRGGAR
jgi:uncharacterized protein